MTGETGMGTKAQGIAGLTACVLCLCTSWTATAYGQAAAPLREAKDPAQANYGSSGAGSSPHLTTELFNSMAGIQMTHVPYKGIAQAITAQLGNEVQVSFSNMFSTMGPRPTRTSGGRSAGVWA